MTTHDDDDRYMARALALAARGEGLVEPNPMVGCVIVRNGKLVGEGCHLQYGGPHAEVVALEGAGGEARGATVYVTLEPCCHHGKTPPCTEALLQAGVARVVIAAEDPFPHVAGRGIAALREGGVACEVGVRAGDARRLLAPYRKLVTTNQPWIIAKWAMTLDGKLATRTGDSQWISSEASRAVVHELRGRVDAIVVGQGTARADDPMLTARPQDPADVKRWAMPVVVDPEASLDRNCRVLRARSGGTPMVAVAEHASDNACQRLIEAGGQIYRCAGSTRAERLKSLFAELGRRRLTNVLVEGGSGLLGTLFDMRAVDEVHVFVAPKLVGGATALSPVGGTGVDWVRDALTLADIAIEELDGDVYIHGRLRKSMRKTR